MKAWVIEKDGKYWREDGKWVKLDNACLFRSKALVSYKYGKDIYESIQEVTITITKKGRKK